MPRELSHRANIRRRHVDALQASRSQQLGEHVGVVLVVLGTSSHERLNLYRMDDLGIMASGDDGVVDPEVEAGRFQSDRQFVVLRLHPLEPVTDVMDIGPYAVVAHEPSVSIQNAGLSEFLMYVQPYVVHGSPAFGCCPNAQMSGEPLLTRHHFCTVR